MCAYILNHWFLRKIGADVEIYEGQMHVIKVLIDVNHDVVRVDVTMADANGMDVADGADELTKHAFLLAPGHFKLLEHIS